MFTSNNSLCVSQEYSFIWKLYTLYLDICKWLKLNYLRLNLLFKLVCGGFFSKRINYINSLKSEFGWFLKSQINFPFISSGSISYFISRIIPSYIPLSHLMLPKLLLYSQCPEHKQPAVWLSHAVAGSLVDRQPVPAVCHCYLCPSCESARSQCPVHQPGRVCLRSVFFSCFNYSQPAIIGSVE